MRHESSNRSACAVTTSKTSHKYRLQPPHSTSVLKQDLCQLLAGSSSLSLFQSLSHTRVCAVQCLHDGIQYALGVLRDTKFTVRGVPQFWGDCLAVGGGEIKNSFPLFWKMEAFSSDSLAIILIETVKALKYWHIVNEKNVSHNYQLCSIIRLWPVDNNAFIQGRTCLNSVFSSTEYWGHVHSDKYSVAISYYFGTA